MPYLRFICRTTTDLASNLAVMHHYLHARNSPRIFRINQERQRHLVKQCMRSAPAEVNALTMRTSRSEQILLVAGILTRPQASNSTAGLSGIGSSEIYALWTWRHFQEYDPHELDLFTSGGFRRRGGRSRTSQHQRWVQGQCTRSWCAGIRAARSPLRTR